MISAAAVSAQSRANVQAAGSSTVLPYANIVAEAFGAETDFATPVVEGGGSSTGRRMLCEGVGEGTIDIANSSSLMRDSERETCIAAGIIPIEVRFGCDGIVFASSTSSDGQQLIGCYKNVILNLYSPYRLGLADATGQLFWS